MVCIRLEKQVQLTQEEVPAWDTAFQNTVYQITTVRDIKQ